MRGEGGAAGEERVVGVAKFHSWGKCTMPLTQIGCPTLPLACVLTYLYYAGPLFRILGCNYLRGPYISHLGV